MNTLLYKDIAKNINSTDPVLSNMRLVVHLAKKYQGMGLSLEDLIHEGTIGICKARDKFDPKQGKFSSYAGAWIKATIRQALNNKSRMIRVPAHKTHIPEIGPKVSQLDPSYQGAYESQIEQSHEVSHLKYKVEQMLNKLKPNQQTIVKMKFGINCNEMKTSEIAKELGLTVQSINGNIRQALHIMKNS
jgi:RNA polymerase sigma factor (sigma-70 family)|tara:strand:+ start:110 stop:676 length:567 start_codon:yes stop_codon:yes gene_type:complete